MTGSSIIPGLGFLETTGPIVYSVSRTLKFTTSIMITDTILFAFQMRLQGCTDGDFSEF